MTFIKESFRVFVSYAAGVFLFTFFLIAPISMENNRNTWIAVYSLVFFVFTVIFLYKQMKKSGESASRVSGTSQSVWKGLVYGFIGFLPFLLLELVYFIVYPNMDTGLGANILHALFRCGFGPMYFIIRFTGYTWYSYAISSIIIPMVAFAGYISGISGKSLPGFVFGRKGDEEDFLSD